MIHLHAGCRGLRHAERDPRSGLVHRLLVAAASLVEKLGIWGTQASGVLASRLQSTGSVVAGQKLSCSTTCAVFPDQGSTPGLLHWQGNSLPLSHQENPKVAKTILMRKGKLEGLHSVISGLIYYKAAEIRTAWFAVGIDQVVSGTQ